MIQTLSQHGRCPDFLFNVNANSPPIVGGTIAKYRQLSADPRRLIFHHCTDKRSVFAWVKRQHRSHTFVAYSAKHPCLVMICCILWLIYTTVTNRLLKRLGGFFLRHIRGARRKANPSPDSSSVKQRYLKTSLPFIEQQSTSLDL